MLTNYPTPPSQQQQQQHLGRVQQTPSQGKDARYKTEWCKHIIQGKVCPFDFKCKFVHSESEMRNFASAHEMADAMPDCDADTYMCMPCLDHVSTGSWLVITCCLLLSICN